MDEDQVKHITDLLQDFGDKAFTKYAKGAEEHGGNLWEMSPEDLLDNAIDEAIDQVVYLFTLKQKIHEMHVL